MRSRYAFATRPVWIAGHLLALTAVVGFVLLGFWQLRRHQERAQLDERIDERIASQPAQLDDLLQEAGDDLAAVEFRPVVVSGRYDPSGEVILQARTRDGRSGHEVLTPLIVSDGTSVIVDRGWVPIDVEGPPVAGAEPPDTPVEVTGYMRLTQVRQGLGPIDPEGGTLERISRVDVDRLQQQVGLPLVPVWIQLERQTPPQATDFPLALPAPEPGGGPPHLSYAVQWFAFTLIVIVAYPLLLRRAADGQEGSGGQRAVG